MANVKSYFDSTDNHPSAIDFRMPKEIVDPKERKAWLEQNNRTDQSAKDDADINKVIARYGINEVVRSSKEAMAQYGDVSDVPSYQESLNLVNYAHEQFAALPSTVRDRFDNSPVKFMEFMHSDKKSAIEESYELGLRVRVEKPTPAPGPIRPNEDVISVKNEPAKEPVVPKAT